MLRCGDTTHIMKTGVKGLSFIPVMTEVIKLCSAGFCMSGIVPDGNSRRHWAPRSGLDTPVRRGEAQDQGSRPATPCFRVTLINLGIRCQLRALRESGDGSRVPSGQRRAGWPRLLGHFCLLGSLRACKTMMITSIWSIGTTKDGLLEDVEKLSPTRRPSPLSFAKQAELGHHLGRFAAHSACTPPISIRGNELPNLATGPSKN